MTHQTVDLILYTYTKKNLFSVDAYILHDYNMILYKVFYLLVLQRHLPGCGSAKHGHGHTDVGTRPAANGNNNIEFLS